MGLSYDMVVFHLMNKGKDGYCLLHTTSFPGFGMIVSGYEHKKRIIINKGARNAFIVQHKQYIASSLNPKQDNKGIQDSLQLEHNEMFIGTQVVGNRLYCLTNLNFYSLYLPHSEG